MATVIVCHGPQKHCHTGGYACYGMICVFPDLCSRPLAKLTRKELARVNRMRKMADMGLKPVKPGSRK